MRYGRYEFVPLSGVGGAALISAVDMFRIDGRSIRSKWHERGCTGRKTLRAFVRNPDRTETLLGRFLLDPPHDMQVDHINGNPLDNRRENLRIATPSENTQNQPARGAVPFKGVSFHKHTGRYQARIRLGGVPTYLGLFDSPEEAAAAYDDAALEEFGPLAATNGTRTTVLLG